MTVTTQCSLLLNSVCCNDLLLQKRKKIGKNMDQQQKLSREA